MKNFNVYHHPVHGYEAVKVGVSWPAFLFGMFWMLFKKLWGWAFCWYCFGVVIAALVNSGNPELVPVAIACYLGLLLGPMFLGNQWRENNLKNRGYTLVESISANNVDDAMSKIVNKVNEHS